MDMSPYGKIKLVGRDACAVLQRICANDIDVLAGRLVYTQWLNSKGGIEADLTVARLSETEFLLVTSAAAIVRGHGLAAVAYSGPGGIAGRSTCRAPRPALRSLDRVRANCWPRLCRFELSNAAFPFGVVRSAELGMAPVRLHRVSYVGELGWEVYVASDMARQVFSTIEKRLQELGGSMAGMLAVESCRIEKAYRHFGHDIAGDDHVLEAGLGFAVKVDKLVGRFGPFIGREAVISKREEGLTRRMVQVLLDDPERMLYHNEPIVRDGQIAGYVTSGAYGHHSRRQRRPCFVSCRADEKEQDVLNSKYQIEIAGTRVAARAAFAPMYDPQSRRMRV